MCNGTESDLVECMRARPWASHNCYHREDAGVLCDQGNYGEFQRLTVAEINVPHNTIVWLFF